MLISSEATPQTDKACPENLTYSLHIFSLMLHKDAGLTPFSDLLPAMKLRKRQLSMIDIRSSMAGGD